MTVEPMKTVDWIGARTQEEWVIRQMITPDGLLREAMMLILRLKKETQAKYWAMIKELPPEQQERCRVMFKELRGS